jgi:hypothetical protein
MNDRLMLSINFADTGHFPSEHAFERTPPRPGPGHALRILPLHQHRARKSTDSNSSAELTDSFWIPQLWQSLQREQPLPAAAPSVPLARTITLITQHGSTGSLQLADDDGEQKTQQTRKTTIGRHFATGRGFVRP